MPPFVRHLPGSDLEPHAAPSRPDLAAVEGVAARTRLSRDDLEIGVDGGARGAVGAEALELRVMAVAARPAA